MEERLDGGNAGGAVRVDETVRRDAGPWTPAVHALLRHLARNGFPGSPRPLGIDGQGREMLTFLEGETVGSTLPWPAWTHTERTLAQVARWLRRYHDVVADFIPPDRALWRMGGQWRPGLIVGHNDAAPYNAVWRAGRLAGFIDWDMAGPVTPAWDLAFAAFSWVPLHARHVVTREGFTSFGSRPARLRLFLAEYGWTGTTGKFLDVVQARVCAHAAGVRALAAAWDPLFTRLIAQGVADDLDTALAELERDRITLTAAEADVRPGARQSSRVGWMCDHPEMAMTLRFEIFSQDLDVIVDFYTRVLGFSVTKDQRRDQHAYVALSRGAVHIGAAQRPLPAAPAERRPPIGVELVFEVDDVAAERDRVVAAGWPLEEDLRHRAWGLTDFRILDPAGCFLRITDRAP